MKISLLLILPWFLAACAASPVPATVTPAESGFGRTKMYAITADAETLTAGVPKNDATITAIMANKYALGTSVAGTATAAPTSTPRPTIPAGTGFCQPADLKADSHSNGVTGNIFLGVGFTNTGADPCYLQTWPQAILVDPAGKPLEVSYEYWDMSNSTLQAGATEQAQSGGTDRIGLQPGQSAGFSLLWSNWCGGAIAGNAVVRLTLGEGAGALDIPTDLQGGGRCDASGAASMVSITAFQYMSLSP